MDFCCVSILYLFDHLDILYIYEIFLEELCKAMKTLTSF